MRLLVAEDDPRLLKTLTHIFESNKFSVDGVSNGEDALAHGQTVEYDGMVLDIMMPGMDGISVLKALREAGVTTPALFLTARSEVSQRVEGLDAGADDYLPKPFSTAELLARVRAMLRRKDNYLPDLLTLGPVTLNRSTYQLSCNGGEQTLSGKEFQLLYKLLSCPDKTFTRRQLMDEIWDLATDSDEHTVNVHINRLRDRFKENQDFSIVTVRGLGYKAVRL